MHIYYIIETDILDQQVKSAALWPVMSLLKAKSLSTIVHCTFSTIKYITMSQLFSFILMLCTHTTKQFILFATKQYLRAIHQQNHNNFAFKIIVYCVCGSHRKVHYFLTCCTRRFHHNVISLSRYDYIISVFHPAPVSSANKPIRKKKKNKSDYISILTALTKS